MSFNEKELILCRKVQKMLATHSLSEIVKQVEAISQHKTRFELKEIKEYLEGCRFEGKSRLNCALDTAISDLEDPENGLAIRSEGNVVIHKGCGKP